MFLKKLNESIENEEKKYKAYIQKLNYSLNVFEKLHQDLKDKEYHSENEKQNEPSHTSQPSLNSNKLTRKNQSQKEDISKNGFNSTTDDQSREKDYRNEKSIFQEKQPSKNLSTKPTLSISSKNSGNTGSVPSVLSNESTKPLIRSTSKNSISGSTTQKTVKRPPSASARVPGVGGATSSSVIGSFNHKSQTSTTVHSKIPLSKKKTISSMQKESKDTVIPKSTLSIDEILRQAKLMKENLKKKTLDIEDNESISSHDTNDSNISDNSSTSNISTSQLDSENQNSSETATNSKQRTIHSTQIKENISNRIQKESIQPQQQSSIRNQDTTLTQNDDSLHPLEIYQNLFKAYSTSCIEMDKAMESFLKTMHTSILPSSKFLSNEWNQFASNLNLVLGIKDFLEQNVSNITESELDEAEKYLEDIENPDYFATEHEDLCMNIMFREKKKDIKIKCRSKIENISGRTTNDLSISKWIPLSVSSDIYDILTPPANIQTIQGEKNIIYRINNKSGDRLVLPYHSKKELRKLLELRHKIQFIILLEYIETNVAKAFIFQFKQLNPQGKDFLWLYRLVDSVLLRLGDHTCTFVPKKHVSSLNKKIEDRS